MLEDRDYMRAPSSGWRWSLTTVLLLVNAIAFVVQKAAETYVPTFPTRGYFALSVAGLQHGYVWQLLTYQFMHANLLHLLGNLLVLYFFGRTIEEDMGRGRFLTIYFGSGVFGALLQLTASELLPRHFAGGVLGASAGVFGLVAAFATLYPERPLTLLVFFVLPVSIRAKYLLACEIALALVGLAIPMDNVAHAAHLGGIMVGFAMARWGSRSAWTSPLSGRVRRMSRSRALAEVIRSHGSRQARPVAPEDLPPAEFISKEVDPILDKISAHGIQSLTPRERRILEAASSRMERR